jgi:lambda family phage portal protein
MAGKISKAVSRPTSVEVVPARSKRRTLSAAGGAVSTSRAQMSGVAAPYEQAADNSRLPIAPQMGPVQLGSYQRRNISLTRHFYRTDGTLRSAYNNLAQGVVGTGPVPRTKFRELMALWRVYSRQSDPTGMLPFGLQVHAIYLESELSGDGLVRIRPRRAEDGLIVPMQLQLLESEFLPFNKTEVLRSGNRVVNGIELDAIDRPTAYWLHRSHPNDTTAWRTDELARVPASEVLHVARPARLGAYRGESRAVAALVSLWRLHGYVDAEMLRKKLAATLAGFIKDSGDNEPTMPGAASEDVDSLIDFLHWEYGQLIQLPASTDITFPNVQDTSGNAIAFIRLLGLIISAALGIPYELVFGDWKDTSDRTAVFSSTYFDLFIEGERRRLEHQLCNPVWRRFVDLCVASGLWTPPPGVPQHHWYEVSWSWPVRSYRHPVQDIEAKLKAMQAGLIDRDSLIEELGYDPEEVDLRQCMAMLRARLYRLKYQSHEDSGDESEFTKRLSESQVQAIEKIVAEIEGAEADEGALGE